MNDLLERDQEEDQQQSEQGGGRGKEASGRRDDQGNRKSSFGSSIDKNLPKGSRLPMGGGGKGNGQGNTAKSFAKEKANKAIDQGLRTAGTAAGGVGRPVAEAVILAKNHPKETLYLILAIVTFASLPILFLLYLFLGDEGQKQQGQQANPLQATFSCNPAQAAIGQTSVCTLNLMYPGSADNVTATVTILAGGQYVSSTPNGTANTTDPNNQTVSWDAKALNLPLANPINLTYTVTVRTTVDNKTVPVTYSATILNGSLSGADGQGYIAPNADNCGGKYKFATPLGKNFGDPACNFNKDQLYTQLKLADPVNADVWFNKIIPCESAYNPNAYAGPQTGTPDAAGAWGLFQMGSANPPGTPPPAEGKNGPNDRGDVNWLLQSINATAYGKRIGALGKYWACAR
jgi:hypothetical protein